MPLPEGFVLDNQENVSLPEGFVLDTPKYNDIPSHTSEIKAKNGFTEEVKKIPKSFAANTVSAVKTLSFPIASAMDFVTGSDTQKERLSRNVESLRDYAALQAPGENVGPVGRFARGVAEFAPNLVTGGIGLSNLLMQAAANRPVDLVRSGVDPSTATKVGLTDLAGTAAMTRMPLRGKTIPGTIAKGAVTNVAAGEGLAAAGNVILGDQYQDQKTALFDPERMGGSAALGAAFGLHQLKAGAPIVTPVKDLNTLAAKGVSKLVSPEKLMASTLKQSKKLSSEQRSKNVETALKEEITPNKKGLDTLYEKIDDVNSQISTAIKNAKGEGKTANVEKIISYLEDTKQRAIDSFGDNQTVLETLDKFGDSLKSHPSVKDGQIPVDVLQKMKVNTYQQLKKSYGELKGFEIEGRKALARGAKDALIEQIPELRGLNAKDSALINLEKELFKAANRIEDRDVISIGVPIKIASGGVVSSKLAALGAVLGLIDTPTIKGRLAIALHKASNRKLSVADATKRLNQELPAILKNQQGAVGLDIANRAVDFAKTASRNQLEPLKEELRDLADEFREIYTKRPAKGKVEPEIDKPFRRLSRLEFMISTKAEVKNQPKTPVKDFARGSKDAIVQEITDLRDELKDMFEGTLGNIPQLANEHGFISNNKIPDHVARIVQDPREVSQSVGMATKEQTKATLQNTLPNGGMVRLTNVDEINSIIKSGGLSSGKNFEGQPGISAQLFDQKKPIVGYGKNNKISAAIVFPEDAAIGKGMGVNEVKINPKYPLEKLRFVIDGYKKLLTYQELRALLAQ